jgi:hypothetical protein
MSLEFVGVRKVTHKTLFPGPVKREEEQWEATRYRWQSLAETPPHPWHQEPCFAEVIAEVIAQTEMLQECWREEGCWRCEIIMSAMGFPRNSRGSDYDDLFDTSSLT